jgi:putative transposase
VDTEGFVLKAKHHSAKVMDYEGIKTLLWRAEEQFPRLTCGWTRATVERIRAQRMGAENPGLERGSRPAPKKPAPEEVMMRWAREWAKGGVGVDWQKLLPPKGFQMLPRRWVVERTIAWIEQNRRMSKDYEKLCASGEAFVYAAMSRLMVRRLARV